MKPITGDAYFSFSYIVSKAIDLNLPLIAAGDLLDQRVNEPGPAVFMERELRRLEKAGLDFWYVQGQHEGDEIPWLQLGRTTKHLQGNVFNLGGGWKATGLDYHPAGRWQEALAALPKEANVFVGHQVLSNWMGDVALPQGCFEDLPEPIQIAIFGDLHEWKWETKWRGKGGQPLRCLSTGATHQVPDITSPNECFFAALSPSGDFKRIRIPTRHYAEFAMTTPEDLDEFLGNIDAFLEGGADWAETNGLPPALHNPLWRIVYNHRLSDAPQRIAKIVAERAHLFWKEIPPAKDETTLALKLPKGEAGEAVTLQTCLPQVVDPEQEPAVFALSQRLLTAEDVTLELAKWKKEILDDGTDTDSTP